MMILTVPITTHKVPLDLPGQGVPGEAPPVHRLSLDARGALAWDGMAIAPEALPGRLEAMTRDPARPILHLKAEAETPYLRFDETLAEVKRAGITRLGLVGNERFVE
jgi:biopolymer transport protein ExbD